MPHLKSVQLEGNSLKSIRRDILARGTVGLTKYLRSRLEEDQLLHLAERTGGQVSPVPSSVSPLPDKYAMKTSQSLGLSGKSLTELPLEAVEAALEARVQAVDLSKNQLTEVPATLDRLNWRKEKVTLNKLKIFCRIIELLYEINISNNKISGIPSFIGLGALLQFLDFSSNRLSELPANFSDLKHLREIILSMNRFTAIPECLYNCAKLETVLIRDNQVGFMNHCPVF